MRCREAARPDAALPEKPAVQEVCRRLAAAIDDDDRDAWLAMTAPMVAFTGGREALVSTLRSTSIRRLLQLPPRDVEMTVVHDCSWCRRATVSYGFGDASPWLVVVEDERLIIWIGPDPDAAAR